MVTKREREIKKENIKPMAYLERHLKHKKGTNTKTVVKT